MMCVEARDRLCGVLFQHPRRQRIQLTILGWRFSQRFANLSWCSGKERREGNTSKHRVSHQRHHWRILLQLRCSCYPNALNLPGEEHAEVVSYSCAAEVWQGSGEDLGQYSNVRTIPKSSFRLSHASILVR